MRMQSVKWTAEIQKTSRESYPVLLEKLQKLFLERPSPMMFFLIIDVGNCFRYLRGADTKCSITFLPSFAFAKSVAFRRLRS
jgi:hypothetical protein